MSAVKATPKGSSPLGRGLSALFGDQDAGYQGLGASTGGDVVRAPKMVPIEFLYPGKYQPRKSFDNDAIQSLADSIREKGVLSPLLVRRHPTIPDAFEIIAGERRWRASQKAGLHELPVIVRELSDRETLEIGLIENIQRQDLNPLDEAEGYQRLMTEFSHTQEALAKSVGKSRSHIANMLRLLALPQSVKEMLQKGDLSMTHARALLAVDNPEMVAQEILTKGLNVRAVEIIAQQQKASKQPQPEFTKSETVTSTTTTVTGKKDYSPVKEQNPNVEPPNVDTMALEKEVSNWLGLAVKLTNFKDGSGALAISYKTLDQLEDVLKRLAVAPRVSL